MDDMELTLADEFVLLALVEDGTQLIESTEMDCGVAGAFLAG